MPVLEKAKLAVLRNRGAQSRTNPEVEPGTEVEVQFNPATLRLKLKNVHDGGENEGRQVRQFIGSNSESYTMDLQFDSADEGRNGEPISVREKTEVVERFLRPRRRGAQAPRLRFMWGDFTIDGVLESLDLEFDHFAYNGVPLRAKATLTLKRQDSSLEILPEESRQSGESTQQAGDSGSGAPGTSGGSGGGDQVAPAQGDETPAEFATRMGLEPAAWRGLDFDVDAGLALSAGATVGFSASAGMSVGLGVHVGVSAGASASIEAGFGLALDASVAAGATASFGASADTSISAGFRLSASGGVEAALELSTGVEASTAVAGTVAAFSESTGGPSSSARALPSGPSRPDQPRTPLAQVAHRPGAHLELPPAPPPPRVDKRARTYGRGLPLRERVEIRLPRPLEREQGRTPTLATRPTQAPWDALPLLDHGRIAADRQQAELSPTQSCERPCVCDDDSTRAPWSIEREEDEA